MKVTFQHPPGTQTPFIDFDPAKVEHYPPEVSGIYIYGIKLEIEINETLVKKFVPLCVGESDNLRRRLYNDHYVGKYQKLNDNITKAHNNKIIEKKELWDLSFSSYSQYDIFNLYKDMFYYDAHNTGKKKKERLYIDQLTKIKNLIYFQNFNYFLVKYKNIFLDPHYDYSADQMVLELYQLTTGLNKNNKESILQNCDKIIRTIGNLYTNFYFIYFRDEHISKNDSYITTTNPKSRHDFEKSIKNILHNINIHTTADSIKGTVIENLELDLSCIQNDLINLGNHNYIHGANYINPLVIT